MGLGDINYESSMVEETLDLILVPEEEPLYADISYQKGSVIIIAGPTASGKTELSLVLAKNLGGEIISADAIQVYRGMDIGSAKASIEQQQQVPHHLLDIRDVDDPINAVDFCLEAKKACDAILSRNKVPILVGGSGFYLKAFMYDSPEGPPSDAQIRKDLSEEVDLMGVDVAYQKLSKLDPKYASTITKNDRQKIIRGLEIIKITGGKVSDLPWKERVLSKEYDFHPWFVYRDRGVLYRRVEERCDWMLKNGFLEEVIRLDRDGIRANFSASQAIGYRQALDYLDGACSEKDYNTFLDKFKQASRNYVKRQFTWFKKDADFKQVDLDIYDLEAVVDNIIVEYLSV